MSAVAGRRAKPLCTLIFAELRRLQEEVLVRYGLQPS